MAKSAIKSAVAVVTTLSILGLSAVAMADTPPGPHKKGEVHKATKAPRAHGRVGALSKRKADKGMKKDEKPAK